MRQTLAHIFTLACALFVLLLAGDLRAQGPLLTWRAQVTHPDPGASPKLLFSAIVDELPTADVAHDRDTGILTIVTTTFIEEEWLAAICTQTGFTLVSLLRGEEEEEEEAGDGSAIYPDNRSSHGDE